MRSGKRLAPVMKSQRRVAIMNVFFRPVFVAAIAVLFTCACTQELQVDSNDVADVGVDGGSADAGGDSDAGEDSRDSGDEADTGGTDDVGDTSPPVELPTFETHFNEPSGGENDDTLEDVIIDYLDRAGPGSKVRAAFYTWSRTRVARAFVDAYEDGVDVRVIVGNTSQHDDGTYWQAIQILREGLGSRLTICSEGQSSGGCIGDGIQHNKFTIFSDLDDGSEQVVLQSSANHTNPQRVQYNNTVIIRGDGALYDAYQNYWYDLHGQQQDLDYYRIFDGDENTRVYFYPRASGDTIVSILNNITCDTDAHIHVGMAYFSNPRTAVADTLAQRFDEGCDVSVLVRENTTGSNVIDALSVPGIDLAVFPADATHSVHSKYLLVDAPYGSQQQRRRLVWTGSHNYTGPALRKHDETLLRLEDDDVYDAFLDNWEMMRAALP